MTLSMLIWAARQRVGRLTFMRRPSDTADSHDGAQLAWHAKDAERRAQEEALYRLSALGIPRR